MFEVEDRLEASPEGATGSPESAVTKESREAAKHG
jgi:hypothetical protein